MNDFVCFREEYVRAKSTISQALVKLDARNPVRAQPMDVINEVGPHDHAYHEVCLVTAGTAIHRTRDGQLPLKTGSVVVMAPAHVHAIEHPARLRVVNVYYLAEWLAMDMGLLWQQPGLVPLFLSGAVTRIDGSVPQFSLETAEFHAVTTDLQDLEKESAEPAPSPVMLRAALLKVLSRMTRAYMRDPSQPMRFAPRPEVWAAINAVESAVARDTPLHISSLARKANLSPDSLGRLFRSDMGRSIRDYYQHRRVHRACQLLLDPRQSITSVAIRLGFVDGAHFTRTFLRHRGMTPRRYRSIYAIPKPHQTPPRHQATSQITRTDPPGLSVSLRAYAPADNRCRNLPSQ